MMTRYLPTTVIEMHPHKSGGWVRHEDVAELEAELKEGLFYVQQKKPPTWHKLYGGKVEALLEGKADE